MATFPTIDSLVSELENRKNEVLIGTKLVFDVAGGLHFFTVTDLFDGGFEIEDNEDGYKEDLFFGELQPHWKFY